MSHHPSHREGVEVILKAYCVFITAGVIRFAVYIDTVIASLKTRVQELEKFKLIVENVPQPIRRKRVSP